MIRAKVTAPDRYTVISPVSSSSDALRGGFPASCVPQMILVLPLQFVSVKVIVSVDVELYKYDPTARAIQLIVSASRFPDTLTSELKKNPESLSGASIPKPTAVPVGLTSIIKFEKVSVAILDPETY